MIPGTGWIGRVRTGAAGGRAILLVRREPGPDALRVRTGGSGGRALPSLAMIVVMLALLPATPGRAQDDPVLQLVVDYQHARPGSLAMDRATARIQASFPPGSDPGSFFDATVAEIQQRGDRAQVVVQVLQILVTGRTEFAQAIFPERLEISVAALGRSFRHRFPPTGPDVAVYDRILIPFSDGTTGAEYVRRGSRGLVTLFGHAGPTE